MQPVRLNLSKRESDFVGQIHSVAAQAIIFDMDDTLYEEIHFVKSFVRALESKVAPEVGLTKAADLGSFYLEKWNAGDRRGLFETTIKEFGLATHPIQFLEQMRTLKVPDGLPMKNWAKQILRTCDLPVAVLTNGDPGIQRNKFRQLDPRFLLENAILVCAKELEPKPSKLGAEKIISDWGLAPSSVLLIGDSQVDEECALAAGCQFLYSL